VIKEICTEGYLIQTRTCRCRNTHYRTKPCPPDHKHKEFPVDEHGHPLPIAPDERICPRCEERAPVKSFRGAVCGFCADVLEKIDANEPARFEP